jgi:hypothetical protein
VRGNRRDGGTVQTPRDPRGRRATWADRGLTAIALSLNADAGGAGDHDKAAAATHTHTVATYTSYAPHDSNAPPPPASRRLTAHNVTAAAAGGDDVDAIHIAVATSAFAMQRAPRAHRRRCARCRGAGNAGDGSGGVFLGESCRRFPAGSSCWHHYPP